MVGVLPWVVVAIAAVLTVVVLVHVVLDKTPDWGLLGVAVVFEAALIVMTVIACVQLLRGGHGLDAADSSTLAGYLLTAVFMVPGGFVWSLSEKSRGSTAVLAIAAATAGFLVFRTTQIWG